jgi:hypothetical protein
VGSSWIAGADNSGFGLNNLPLGIFSTDDAPRPGVAIGQSITDLSSLIRERLIDDETLLDAPSLNNFLAHGPGTWRSLRAQLQHLFGESATEEERDLVPCSAATMHMPIDVGDYVDFYSGIEHATNLGKILRPYGYVRDHARLGGLGRNASRLRRRSRDDRGLDRVVEPVADHVFALPARIAEDLRFFGIRGIDE